MADTPISPAAKPRKKRLGPFLLVAFLAVLLIGWSAFWFIARGRVHDALTIWIAQEATQGRNWSCPERTVQGFPFRFEIRCSDLRFTGSTPAGQAEGHLPLFLAVAQVYKPNHVIVEATGPLVAELSDGSGRVRFNWQTFDASIVFSGNRLDRTSLVMTSPDIRFESLATETLLLSASELESHMRIDPDRPVEDHAYDFALTVRHASLPPLDRLLGSDDKTDIVIQGAITEAAPFTAASPAVELERWRNAGGKLDLMLVRLNKGLQRLDGTASLSLDDLHRPQGRIEASVAGLDELLARFGFGGGGNRGLGALISGGLQILGGNNQRAPGAEQTEQPAGLTKLPPVVLRDGRIYAGPFNVGQVAPLY